jgi:hypothetical protein
MDCLVHVLKTYERQFIKSSVFLGIQVSIGTGMSLRLTRYAVSTKWTGKITGAVVVGIVQALCSTGAPEHISEIHPAPAAHYDTFQ